MYIYIYICIYIFRIAANAALSGYGTPPLTSSPTLSSKAPYDRTYRHTTLRVE